MDSKLYIVFILTTPISKICQPSIRNAEMKPIIISKNVQYPRQKQSSCVPIQNESTL